MSKEEQIDNKEAAELKKASELYFKWIISLVKIRWDGNVEAVPVQEHQTVISAVALLYAVSPRELFDFINMEMLVDKLDDDDPPEFTGDFAELIASCVGT